MYTIKSAYSRLLNELGGMSSPSDEEWENAASTFRAMKINYPLKEIETGVFAGRFEAKSLSLWNEKDGSGGRGEYTVASHFLGSDFEEGKFERKSIDSFFRALSADYTFHKEIKFSKEDDEETIANKFNDYLKALDLDLQKINMTSDSNMRNLRKLRDDPESLRNVKTFRLASSESTWVTVLRKINKMRFLRDISNESSSFSSGDIGLYDLLNSVTTSGSASKSTDVYISKDRLKKEFINILGITKDMSIEVKEISDITNTVDGGSGIRLASGSRLEAMKNDIIFCLTIICIITDISTEDELFEDKKNLDDNVKEILVSLKNNQVAASKVKDLIKYLAHPSVYRRTLKGLINLLDRSEYSRPKKDLGYNAIKLLDNMFTSEMTSSDRRELINTGLSTAIANSINADYLCIIHGHNSDKYKNNSGLLGNDQFILIHKDRYKDILGFGSYQNGGTAYATIKNKEVASYFRELFSTKSLAENLVISNSFYSKREIFIKKLLAEGGKAGHMMHPYENLHMKISDMKEMISDFQNDFEISEKVDGANLFFTINPDTGELLFSRNKADMTREETLEKFGPSHPAHILFTEGANSIYNAAKASLNRSDIKAIFGQAPDGGKTYINFEIMHPKKPNQIKYDMKYVVFHTIVDFDINGVKVSSSPDDPRLLSLLEKMQSYFATEDNDFNLGSNLKVKLNALSDADIDELMTELNKITSSLNLSDDMTIADAIKKEIEMLLDKNNLSELLSEDKIEMIYDFITNESSTVTGNIIKKDLDKDIKKSLVGLGLTSKTKAYKIVKQVTKEFRPLFILLGIKLLHNIPSRYMSSEASNKNVDELRRLLNAALEDYDNLINLEDPSDIESRLANTLSLHVANIRSHGIERSVSSPIEGGVFIGKDGNTYKVTGGFAPLNQILGTAMRSLDHMPVFEREFDLQERRG
jgi:hypothetical protein